MKKSNYDTVAHVFVNRPSEMYLFSLPLSTQYFISISILVLEQRYPLETRQPNENQA